jgi:hypothetical protein
MDQIMKEYNETKDENKYTFMLRSKTTKTGKTSKTLFIEFPNTKNFVNIYYGAKSDLIQ